MTLCTLSSVEVCVCVDSSSFEKDKANTDCQRLYGSMKTAEQCVYVAVFEGLFAYPK